MNDVTTRRQLLTKGKNEPVEFSVQITNRGRRKRSTRGRSIYRRAIFRPLDLRFYFRNVSKTDYTNNVGRVRVVGRFGNIGGSIPRERIVDTFWAVLR